MHLYTLTPTVSYILTGTMTISFFLMMKKTWIIVSSTLVLFTVPFIYTTSDKALLYWQDRQPEI